MGRRNLYGVARYVWMGYTDLIRGELGLAASETVVLGLRSLDGSQRAEKRMRLTRQGFSLAKLSLPPARKLDGGVGYVRIGAMDNRLVKSTVREIKRLRDSDGLILDVRDNGGGTYSVLRAIYGFFIPDDSPPYVTNIAAYRQSERFYADHIAYRPTYRAEWDGWSDEERAVIERAGRGVSTRVAARPRRSSATGITWCSVASGADARRTITSFYDKPVVVLCNAGSFSATDGFLSAMADLPQVTIVGEPSGGGSGATRRFNLPKHTDPSRVVVDGFLSTERQAV